MVVKSVYDVNASTDKLVPKKMSIWGMRGCCSCPPHCTFPSFAPCSSLSDVILSPPEENSPGINIRLF